jgi:hypothetical protein
MLEMKRALSRELKEQVYALRYRAYRSVDAIEESPYERFSDAYDEQPNHALWALLENGRLVGSIRSAWYEPQSVWSIPELDTYATDLALVPGAELGLYSGNRFVVCPDFAKRSDTYAMHLLRFHILLAQTFPAVVLAAVRGHHVPFYKRVLLLERVSKARLYPGLNCSMYLLACRYHEQIAAVYEKTPSLFPKEHERMLVDPAAADRWESGVKLEALR